MQHLRNQFLLASLMLTLAFAGFATRAADESAGWKSLLTDTNLSAWQGAETNRFWKVVNGVLVGENDSKLKGDMLWTKASYRDFVIECETRWSVEIDSGIVFRKPELQMQMGISRSLKKDMTCSFYTGSKEKYPEAGQAKGFEKIFKPDDWNQYRLEARGDTFTVWLNGQQVVQYKNTNFPAAAPIGVQIHPGLKMKVEFRNLRIKSLD